MLVTWTCCMVAAELMVRVIAVVMRSMWFELESIESSWNDAVVANEIGFLNPAMLSLS